ncbi:MAG: T9SS type A sorting domain-containing protein [Bacteroidetes bacterium]|nr:T9SS type A sorting domain-containing protein [Bacteroidota bacterium]
MRNFILLLCFCWIYSVPAQQWDWVKNVSYTTTQEVSQLAPDSNSNFYLATNSNSLTSCITKFNVQGNQLWKLYLQGFLSINGIVCAQGNVYITGAFSNSLQIGSYGLISNGSTDIFTACFTSNGNVVWATSYGGAQEDIGSAVCADGSGNILITGQYSGTASFGTTSLVSQGGNNMFFAKLDPLGNILILKSAGSQNTSAYGSRGQKIKSDLSGNIYVMGVCSDLVLDTLHRVGYGSTFICKLDSMTTTKWVTLLNESYTIEGFDFILDLDGNMTVTGEYNGNHERAAITKKYNSNGQLIWSRMIGTLSYGQWFQSNSIATNGYDCFIVGAADDTYINSARNNFFLLASYDSAGTRTILDTLYCGNIFNGNHAEGKSIVRDSNGDFVLAGNMKGNLKLGNDSLFTTTESVFIAKFKGTNSAVSVSEKNFLMRNNIYPNPSQGIFTIEMGEADISTLCVYDAYGNCILQRVCNDRRVVIDLRSQPKGIYLIEIKDQNRHSVKKIIIQ